MRIREPENQYDFEAKRQYREAVWQTFAENVVDVSTARVLFFPGRHGFEIEVALRHGFKEENLIACEENPAIIARAKWRQQYPGVRCYANELQRTIERLKHDGVRLDAANLDFCSNLSDTHYGGLTSLLTAGITVDTFVLAVSVLKGRENQALVSTVRAMTGTSGPINRVECIRRHIINSLHRCTFGLVLGEYRSGTKNMVWVIWLVRPEAWLISQYGNWIASHLSEIQALHESNEAARQYARPTSREYSVEKVMDYTHESRRIAEPLLLEYQQFQNSVAWWGARNRICEEVARWHELVEAMSPIWNWLNGAKGIEARLTEAKFALKETRERLIKSESEKAQLLQAGRAWR